MAGGEAQDAWAAVWEREHRDTDRRAGEAIQSHVESEWHAGRFRFVTLGCDMGVPGTALALTGLWGHRVIDFPLQLVNWKLTASPAAGSAVVDVLKATNLAAFAAGTYASICGSSKPTLSGARQASGDALGVWPTVDWAVGEVLVWEVESVSGSVEVLTAQLSARRV